MSIARAASKFQSNISIYIGGGSRQIDAKNMALLVKLRPDVQPGLGLKVTAEGADEQQAQAAMVAMFATFK